MLAGMLLADALQWPVGMDKNVIVFTDEYMQYEYSTDLADVESDCLSQPYQVGAFVRTWGYEWDSLVTNCGGFRDDLLSDPNQMADSMKDHFFGDCQ